MFRLFSAALAALLLAALLLPTARAQDPPKPPEEPPAPAASPAVVKILEEADVLLQAKKPQEALAAADRALAAAREGKDAPGEAWTYRMRALALAGLERPEDAVAAWQATAAAWERAGDGPGRVEALAQAGLLLARQQAESATQLLEQALALGEAETKRPLAAAAALDAAGRALRERRRLPEARRFLQAGLTLRRKAAPESLAVAASLSSLGMVALDQGDLKAARDRFQRALAIQERLAPGSLSLARSLGNLGSVAHDEGDLRAARHYFQQALAIQQQLAPVSLDAAATLNNLGSVASRLADPGGARDYFQRALAIHQQIAPASPDAMASLHNLGRLARQQGDLTAAGDYYRRALAIRQVVSPGSLEVAANLHELGALAAEQGELTAAQGYHEGALAIRQKLLPGSLYAAQSLSNLGIVRSEQGDLKAARECQQQALAIRERLAPGSLDVAATLNNLGIVAVNEGDLSSARQFHAQALAIRQRLAPGSLAVARSLNNLGLMEHELGDMEAAREYHQQALAIKQKLAPGSLDMAASLNNLGMIAGRQWDWRAARAYFHQALAIQQQRIPGSLDAAITLNNLGATARGARDLEAAREYHRQALTIRERLAPGSLHVAQSLSNLGFTAHAARDLGAARDLYQQALAIQEQRAPGSLHVAGSLNQLGLAAADQGDLAAAQGFQRRALAIYERSAPGSLEVAAVLYNLGLATAGRKDLHGAAAFAHRAWRLVRQRAGTVPGDEDRQAYQSHAARYAARLAEYRLALGKTAAAFNTLEEGRAQALQQQLLDRQVSLRDVTAELRADYQNALAAAGRAYEQSSRASLKEGEARAALAAARDGKAPPVEVEKLDAVLKRAEAGAQKARFAWTEARDRAGSLRRQVLKGAGGALPQPLSLREAGRALTPQTLFLAYSVGEKRSHLFLVAARAPREAGTRQSTSGPAEGPAVAAFTLPVGEQQLREQVALLRAAIRDRGARLARSRKVAALLLPRAAVARIRRAKRLVISPDGPLWELPFAALVLPVKNGRMEEWTSGRSRDTAAASSGVPRPPRVQGLGRSPFVHTSTHQPYLGLAKPITYAPSLALFAQARRERLYPARDPRHRDRDRDRDRDPASLGAPSLGAPSLGAPSPAAGPGSGSRRVQALVLGDLLFTPPQSAPADSYGWREEPLPLPATRAEARRVAGLYGGRPLTGAAATEAEFRKQAVKADVIHLATHGWLHPHQPQSSFVLLALPQREAELGQSHRDGYLQAREIQGELSLRAELVVLSACRTAEGELVRAEGIVGLARALQVAGARSVVASQWQVADASTAALMVEFHRQLRRGVAKDEALRRAMLSVAKRSGWRDPFYWAPFVLLGDPDNPNLRAARGQK